MTTTQPASGEVCRLTVHGPTSRVQLAVPAGAARERALAEPFIDGNPLPREPWTHVPYSVGHGPRVVVVDLTYALPDAARRAVGWRPPAPTRWRGAREQTRKFRRSLRANNPAGSRARRQHL